ncbi:MAG TPA: hypothetical protein EYN34_05285 [Aquifex sp.]|nr:hypothetical protein [Aquifex sp.]
MDCAPYFGEIDGDIYIDLYSVKWLRLTETEEGYRWEFHLDGIDKPIYSKPFRDKDAAKAWLEMLADYYYFGIEDLEGVKIYTKREPHSENQTLWEKIKENLLFPALVILFFAVLGGFALALLKWVYHLAEKFLNNL